MSDNKHTGRGWNGKGYYIALILCAAAIGITSYVYSRNTETAEEVLLQESEVIPVGTMTAVEDIPVIATQPQPESTGTVPPSEAPAQPTVKPRRKIQSPVAGQEIHGYSMETLS